MVVSTFYIQNQKKTPLSSGLSVFDDPGGFHVSTETITAGGSMCAQKEHATFTVPIRFPVDSVRVFL